MKIELQIKADIITSLIRNRLQAEPVCITDEFVLLGEQYFLDHFEVLSSTSLERENVKTMVNVPGSQPIEINASVVRVVQPIQLFLVKMNDLAANGPNATPAAFSPTISLAFRLTLKVENNATRFCVQFSGIDMGLFNVLAPNIANEIEQRMQLLLAGDVCSTLNISSIANILGTPITPTNAGIVTDAAGKIVVLRIEVNGIGNSVSSWQNFYNNNVSDYLGNSEWSLFMDKELIVSSVVQSITKEMQGNSTFSLTTSPSGSWSFASGPRIDVKFSGEAIDACNCFGVDIDVNVDVTFTVTLSVPKDSTLQMTADVDWDANNWEIACCVLSSALFWPFVGAIMLKQEKINWGEFLGGMAGGPLATLIGGLVAASNQGMGNLPLDATCTKESDKRFVCTQPVSVSAGMVGKLTITGISAISEGAIFVGNVLSGVEFGTASVSIKQDPFVWHIDGTCSTGFHIQNSATIQVANVGKSPVAICEVEVLDDPLTQYSPFITVEKHALDPGWVVGDVKITPKSLKPDFLANPYPCKVLIKTNGGVRLLSLKPPQAITPQQSKNLKLLAINSKAQCFKILDSFFEGKIFSPKWIPNRQPSYAVLLHLWHFIIAGLPVNAIIKLSNEYNEVLARTYVMKPGITNISVLLPPAITPTKELALQFENQVASLPEVDSKNLSSSMRKISKSKRMIIMKQILMVERGQLAFNKLIKSVNAGWLSGNPVVLLVDEHQFRAYDVTIPKLPRLIEQISVDGLQGATVWNDTFLLWGKFGLIQQTLPGTQLLRIAQPIRDCSHSGQHLVALTDESVEILDAHLEHMGSLSVKGANHLLVIGQRLILDETNQLGFIDIKNPSKPDRKGSLSIPEPAGLSGRRIIKSYHGIFVRHKGGGGTVYNLKGEVPFKVIDYVSDPWFFDSTRVGKVFARLNVDHTMVKLYKFVKMHRN